MIDISWLENNFFVISVLRSKDHTEVSDGSTTTFEVLPATLKIVKVIAAILLYIGLTLSLKGNIRKHNTTIRQS